MIAVIDSGVANLASVMGALKRLDAAAEITVDPAKIRAADRVIVPGVGAAAAAMAQLHARKLVDVLRSLTQPMLGICLGMQLLFEQSEEDNGTNGLGILLGTVKLLRPPSGMSVPHMGWNQLTCRNPKHPLMRDIADGSFVYFVHSYVAPVADATLATTDYGETFTSVVAYKNFYGCQFHPERSGAVGRQILKNFMSL